MPGRKVIDVPPSLSTPRMNLHQLTQHMMTLTDVVLVI